MVHTPEVPMHPASPPPYVPDAQSTADSALRKHEEYYIDEGNCVIQINNVLYKIWDYMLRRHSQFFQMNPPQSLAAENAKKENILGSEKNPIILRNVEERDFDRLLWILYPPVIGELKANSIPDWVAILELSTRWKFKDIRDLAIRQLAAFDISPVEKIELMQRYKIKPQWAYTSFVALCSRPCALDVIEGRQLGIETIIKIAFARERLERGGRKKPSEVKNIVKEIFELEPPAEL